MKMIYDIKDHDLCLQIRQAVDDVCHHVIEMTYSQISIADFIFKSFDSIDDIKELRQYQFDSHQLIAVITDEKILVDLLHFYPLCYIRKKYAADDLRQCLSLLKMIDEHKDKILSFAVKESFVRLRSSHIYYIEAFSHYLMIYTYSGNYMIRHTVKEMIKKLPDHYFKQVHRSYIVNRIYIKEIFKDHLVLEDETVIPVGRKYRQQILGE